LALLIALVWIPAAAYISITTSPTDGTPVKWDLDETTLPLPNVDAGEVIYQINSAGSDNIGDTSEFAAIEAAFRHWEGIPRSRIAFSRGPDTALAEADDDGANLVYWAEASKTPIGGKNTRLDGIVSLTVVNNELTGPATGLIRNADIILNGFDHTWTTDPASDPNSYDVEAVVTHEVGHALGLEHSPVVGSSLYARSTTAKVWKRSLESDDIVGASSLYPDQDETTGTGTQNGFVQVGGVGTPVFGALVTTLDADGGVLAEGASQPNGAYANPGLPPGSHTTYVEAMDANGAGASTLFEPGDLAPGFYDSVATGFLASVDLNVSISAGGTTARSFGVTVTSPSLHISGIGQRATTSPSALIFGRRPTPLLRGDTNVYIGVAGPGLTQFQTFEILGTGVTVNGVAATGPVNGEPGVVYDVSVDANAPLGLRSIRVLFGGEFSYATGAVQIMDPNVPMTAGILELPGGPPGTLTDPVEVSVESGGIRITWPALPDAFEYNLWRGDLSTLASTGLNHAPVPGPNGSCGLVVRSTLIQGDLTDGIPHYYLVSGRNALGEGLLGPESTGTPRPIGTPACP
jgi:hypothetical protein